MRMSLNDFIGTVVGNVVSGLILLWMGGERAPARNSNPCYHYLLVAPDKPRVSVPRDGHERLLVGELGRSGLRHMRTLTSRHMGSVDMEAE